ncbi:HlyD family efflux transporter periplasmic adaptor subunit [Bradyrhizobium genosp. A]|uniref:HlyD family efflux transporter periplasmic adaptor subunit n=1 Tax=Bradyrhizobium genosp. A TaxID=83626 RepID=UPI003CEB8E86
MLSQKEAERATTAATIAKIEATIPLLKQRVDVRKYLADKEYGSKLQYLTEMQDLVGLQQELLVQKNHIHESESAVTALSETRLQTIAEYRRARFDELAKAEQKAGGLAQDVIKAEQRTRLLALTAPVDGVVQQLAVHTVGGVVTPAQALLAVVPRDSRLEIEAMVSNRDIGFVHPGQQAEVKVDTFSFTRYGLLHGEVINVSQDAITRDLALLLELFRTGDLAPNSCTPAHLFGTSFRRYFGSFSELLRDLSRPVTQPVLPKHRQ